MRHREPRRHPADDGGRAQASGQTVEQVTASAMANQSIKRLVDSRDIAAVAVFLASDSAKAISGQMVPIDNDVQQAWTLASFA